MAAYQASPVRCSFIDSSRTQKTPSIRGSGRGSIARIKRPRRRCLCGIRIIFAVDPAGNQLPYIDRVQFEFVDKKILPISAANGGATMQDRGLRFQRLHRTDEPAKAKRHARAALVSGHAIAIGPSTQTSIAGRCSRTAGYEMEEAIAGRQALSPGAVAGDRSQADHPRRLQRRWRAVAGCAGARVAVSSRAPSPRRSPNTTRAKASALLDAIGLSKRDQRRVSHVPRWLADDVLP